MPRGGEWESGIRLMPGNQTTPAPVFSRGAVRCTIGSGGAVLSSDGQCYPVHSVLCKGTRGHLAHTEPLELPPAAPPLHPG